MEKSIKTRPDPEIGGAGEPKQTGAPVKPETRGKRYGEAVKRLVVEQLEAGKLTVAQAQRQHGIAGTQTIRGWQAKYGKEGGGVRRNSALAAAQAQIVKLKQEKADLEHALGRLTVKSVVLECAMEEAEVQYGEDFKKKFAPALSSVRGSGSGGKG